MFPACETGDVPGRVSIPVSTAFIDAIAWRRDGEMLIGTQAAFDDFTSMKDLKL